MNDELKERMTKYLDGLERTAGKVGDFAETEVPATIREWLIWMTIEHSVFAIMFLIAAITAYKLMTKALSAAESFPNNSFDKGPAMIFSWAGRVIIPAGLLIGFFVQGMWAAKCVIAPRVVVVEKMAELVKGGRE